MIYGSICSGIESATVAWHPLGWKPAFFSEIDPAPRDVLSYRHSHVPLHGDFTTIQKGQYDDIRLLVGGTPCQDFSVAGLRKGIDGDRGNLSLEFIKLVGRLRPQWVVWENVPGVLSINEGRAFGSVLGGLAEFGYGFAYRVLDAQYYGLAQRRERVFVVGYFGDWRPSATVLFERESLSGNPPPSREKGEGIAGNLASRTSGGGGFGTDFECTGGLQIAHTLKAEGADASEDGTGRGTPLIPVIAPTLDGRSGRSGENSFATSGGLIPEISPALKARDYKGPSSDGDGDGDGAPLIAFDCRGTEVHNQENIAMTLRSMNAKGGRNNDGSHIAIAFAQNQMGEVRTGEVSGTINTNNNASGRNAPLVAVGLDLRNALRDPEKHDSINRQGTGIGGDVSNTLSSSHSHGVATVSAVRRLTPRECERLQGFDDDYTLVPRKGGKMMSDSARYRMIGNSKAVPVIRKIGQRIQMVDKFMESAK